MNPSFKNSFSFLLAFFFSAFLTISAQVKPTDANERMEGISKRKLMMQNSLLQKIAFRNIGPTQMNGRVVDIEVNPSDATEFYVAYASGGLWHTTNNGLSFTSIFDQEDVLSIGDIAVNWKRRMIWVGTGEVNSSRSSYSGVGIYTSSDNGKHWIYRGLPESHHIGEIILHPVNDQIAWVAALGHLYSPNKERGVYKTTDGGQSWKQVLALDENTGAVEMDINLSNPDELYACMWYRTRRAWDFQPTGATSGIYKSLDGGENWNLISGPESGFPQGEKIGRSGIAVFQGNPKILYAVVDNNNIKPDTAQKKMDTSHYALFDFKSISKLAFMQLNDKKLDSFLIKNDFPTKYNALLLKALIEKDSLQPNVLYDWMVADDGFQNAGIFGCEVYRSDDAGWHWHKVNKKDIDVFSSYGYYFGKIFVSPVNENKVITFGTSMIVSEDGGSTFTAVDKNNTHGDWHSCWINPNKDSHWIAGNDGGCNITYDGGKKWFKTTCVPAGQFYHITVDDAKPFNVYGGLQDNGSWMGSSEGNIDDQGFSFAEPSKLPEPDEYEWRLVGEGDGMQVQIDTRDNNTLYTGFQFGYYFRSKLDKSDKTVMIHPMHDLGEQKLRYNWQTPILLSKHQQDILYYGTNKFHRSLQQGNEMVTMTSELTNGKKQGKIPYGTITTISESPLHFGLIYIGTDDGNIQVSKDGGYSFLKINIESVLKNIPKGLWVSKVVASMHKESRVYACLNGYRFDHFKPYLFVSDDYGKTWMQLAKDLPYEPLNTVKEDVLKEDILYVGSDNGLYASFDRGIHFMTLGDLPRVPVHELVIQARDRALVVGTHGRSVFIAAVDSVYKVYESYLQTIKDKSKLRVFNELDMHAGEGEMGCPTPKQLRRSRKKVPVVISIPASIKTINDN